MTPCPYDWATNPLDLPGGLQLHAYCYEVRRGYAHDAYGYEVRHHGAPLLLGYNLASLEAARVACLRATRAHLQFYLMDLASKAEAVAAIDARWELSEVSGRGGGVT